MATTFNATPWIIVKTARYSGVDRDSILLPPFFPDEESAQRVADYTNQVVWAAISSLNGPVYQKDVGEDEPTFSDQSNLRRPFFHVKRRDGR
jgi:hypothetical protein